MSEQLETLKSQQEALRKDFKEQAAANHPDITKSGELMDSIESLQAKIDLAEREARLAEREAELEKRKFDTSISAEMAANDLAQRGKDLGQSVDENTHIIAEARNTMNRMIRAGVGGSMENFTRALDTSDATNHAGALVSESLQAELLKEMNEHGVIRQAVGSAVRTAPNGWARPWPTLNLEGIAGSVKAENAAAPDNTSQIEQFGQVTQNFRTYTSGEYRASREILEDSQEDLLPELMIIAGRSISEQQELQFRNHGTDGIIASVTGSQAVTSEATETVTPRDILRLPSALKLTYQRGGVYIMHQRTLDDYTLAPRATNDAAFYVPGNVNEGRPARIYGYTVMVDNTMEVGGASETTPDQDNVVLFCNFAENFGIVDVANSFDINVDQSSSVVASMRQVRIVGFLRTAFKLLRPTACAVLKTTSS